MLLALQVQSFFGMYMKMYFVAKGFLNTFVRILGYFRDYFTVYKCFSRLCYVWRNTVVAKCYLPVAVNFSLFRNDALTASLTLL